MRADRHLYNDNPIIEEPGWQLLSPTKWAVKWKNMPEGPIVIHQCEEDWREDVVIELETMKERPRCGLCKKAVPEGIQAVWQLSHMEAMLG